MGQFFGKPEFATPEGAYSWQHMLHVSISLAIAIVMAIVLGRKNRNKDMATKNKVLIWTAFIMHTVETMRIFIGIGASYNGMSWLWELPFFLCSMQFITIPIAALGKGKLKEVTAKVPAKAKTAVFTEHALATLYMGVFSAKMLYQAGKLIADNETIELLDKMFPALQRYFNEEI